MRAPTAEELYSWKWTDFKDYYTWTPDGIVWRNDSPKEALEIYEFWLSRIK